jgi:hypothetical protein
MAIQVDPRCPVLVLGRQAGSGLPHTVVAPTYMSSARSPDMAAMWQFLRGEGYQADIAALRQDYQAVGWTSFTTWAERTFQP